jgi:hypothetical protein
MLGGKMFEIPVVDGVSAVGACESGDQSQINAFSEAPELGARFDATVNDVHVGGIIKGGKRKKRTKGKKKGRKGNGKSRGKGRGKPAKKGVKGKNTRGKKRQHRKNGYKMTLRR